MKNYLKIEIRALSSIKEYPITFIADTGEMWQYLGERGMTMNKVIEDLKIQLNDITNRMQRSVNS